MSTPAELLNQVLALPDSDRAYMAHQLLLSLDKEPCDDDWAEAWSEEIDRRLDRVERGESIPVDWRIALAEGREKLRRGSQP